MAESAAPLGGSRRTALAEHTISVHANWSIVKVAGAVSAIIGFISATAGVVKWIQSQSLTEAIDFVITTTGRVAYIAAIPLILSGVVVVGLSELWERPRTLTRPILKSGLLVAGSLGLAALSALVTWRWALADHPSLSVKATGVGLLMVAAWGTVMMTLDNRQSHRAEWRECPDCCSPVLVRARVCRFCGYRFKPPPGDGVGVP